MYIDSCSFQLSLTIDFGNTLSGKANWTLTDSSQPQLMVYITYVYFHFLHWFLSDSCFDIYSNIIKVLAPLLRNGHLVLPDQGSDRWTYVMKPIFLLLRLHLGSQSSSMPMTKRFFEFDALLETFGICHIEIMVQLYSNVLCLISSLWLWRNTWGIAVLCRSEFWFP